MKPIVNSTRAPFVILDHLPDRYKLPFSVWLRNRQTAVYLTPTDGQSVCAKLSDYAAWKSLYDKGFIADTPFVQVMTHGSAVVHESVSHQSDTRRLEQP